MKLKLRVIPANHPVIHLVDPDTILVTIRTILHSEPMQ